MKIRMLTTHRGSPDGIRLESYEAGSVYDLSGTERERDLAAAFVKYGWGEEDRAKPAPVVEAKAQPAVTENKAIEAAPENKGRRR